MQGLITGLLVTDYRQRKADRHSVLKLSGEAAEAALKLSELHNKQVEQIKQIYDKVNAHEIYIKSSAVTNATTGMRKF